MNTLTIQIDFVVNTVADLSTVPSPNTFVMVKDLKRGGIFKYEATGYTTDSGIVFPATTIGSGHWVRQFTGTVCADWFGAVGDGVTNDTSAIQFALNSGRTVHLQDREYYVATSINMGDNNLLTGGTLITDQDVSIVVFNGVNSSVCNVKFKGSRSSGVLSNQHGINRNGNGNRFAKREGNLVDNCRFINLGGAGYYCTISQGSRDTGTIGSSFPYGSTQLTNCFAIDCENGYFCDERGEYNSFSNCQANGCTNGVYFKGGNNNWVGGQLTGNDTNFRLGAGANGAHCTISGAKINHAITNSIVAEGTTLPWRFTNCDIYVGNIIITSSVNVRFIGCDIGLRGYKIGIGTSDFNLTITDSSTTVFDQCLFVTSGIYTKVGTSVVDFLDCKWLATQYAVSPNKTVVPKIVTSAAASFTIPSTSAKILAVYTGTTGTVTIPLLADGVQDILIVHKGASGTLTVSYSGGAARIWNANINSATTTLTAGQSVHLVNDGTDYLVVP